MDITTVFGTVILGSNPGGRTKLAIPTPIFYKGKTVDNDVYIVYKGHI